MKATEQYLSVLLFVTLYKVVLNFEWCKLNPRFTVESYATKQKYSAFPTLPKISFKYYCPQNELGCN